MSITSTKNLGLRGSKGRIVEKNIEDEIYIGGPFFTSYGLGFESTTGFFSVDEAGNFDKSVCDQPYGFLSNGINIVYKAKQQPDGKILLGGSFVGFGFNSSPTSRLFRLNTDKTVDTTFFSYIISGFSQINGTVHDIDLQPDGKIVIVGDFNGFSTGGGVSTNRIARLNSNSTVDSTFNVGTGFGTSTVGPVRVVKVLSDGKILLGTPYTTYNGITVTRLLRLNSNGSVDDTFNIGTGPSSTVTCIEFQSDGKMLVGGLFTTFNGVTVNRIVRLNTDLSIDDTFRINTGTAFGSDVETIAIQPDGKILVGGNFTTFNSVSTNRLVRLNEDGSRDTTFDIGTGFNDRVRKVNVELDGKILVGGLYSTYRSSIFNRIVGLTYNGDVDDTFDVGYGITLESVGNSSYGVYDILKLNTGKMLITGGEFTAYRGNSYNRKFLKLNSNFEVDNIFQQAFVSFYSPSAGAVNDIKIQSDGKVLVAGDGTSFSLVRLHRDGKRDASLAASLNDGLYSIDIHSDGSIIVGGLFTTVNSISSNRIAKLNSFGVRDASFNVGSGSNSTVNVVKVHDDKVLIGGSFTSYSGSVSNRIARINSDGTIDNTFNIGDGFNNTVEAIQIQNDGKILIGGSFTSYSGSTSNRLVRINFDGTIDTTFDIGTGFGSTVECIYIQHDERILVGGAFYSFNGFTDSDNLIRLLSNGSRDTSFIPQYTERGGDGVFAIDMTSDNRILIGGDIIGINGISRAGFAVLKIDGSLAEDRFDAARLFTSGDSRFGTSAINAIAVKK